MTSKNRGVIFIKLAVAMPLILAVIVFIVFLSRYLLARNVLKTSIEKGVAIGRTYGNPAFANRGEDIDSIASEIDRFVSSQSAPIPPGLYRNPKTEVESTYKVLMADSRNSNFPSNEGKRFTISSNLNELPSSYLLSMAIIYDSVLKSYGGDIRFPCSFEDLKDTPGCLSCFPFIQVSTTTISQGEIEPQPGQCLPQNEIFIECIWNVRPFSTGILRFVFNEVTVFPTIVLKSGTNANCSPPIFSNQPSLQSCSWCK